MHKTLGLIVVSIVTLTIPICFAAKGSPTVESVNRPPNYPLCTDKEDISQLTDGKLAPFPIWTNRLTVGWAETTPIAVQIRISGKRSQQSPRAGILRVHAAKGLQSGVDVPRQLDVYARDSTNMLRLVGSLTPDSRKLRDKDVHWLDVPVTAATDTLVLIVHAGGRYLFLDEIEWHVSGTGQIPYGSTSISNVQSALEHSTRRTQERLEMAEVFETNRLAPPGNMETMNVWVQDPWGAIDPKRAPKLIGNAPPTVEVRGYASERETICLGITAGKDVVSSGLRVTVSGLPANSVKIYEVKSVVVANGQRVFDPLIPLGADGQLTPKSGIPTYVWLDLDLSILGAGIHRFDIHIEGNNRISLPGTAQVTAFNRADITPLRAINWSYLSDMPIFQNQDKAVDDLVSHGINIFVAHPGEIPGLALDGTWSAEKANRLVHMIELAKEHGMLLLYLGWDSDKNPFSFSTQEQRLSPVTIERLLTWVRRIATYLAANGLSQDRWALYPVDEPNQPGLQLIKAIAEVIKRHNPQIQIYADPTVHQNRSIKVSDLREMEGVVDYWQPNLLAVRGSLGNYFRNRDKEWWIYGNPKSPAKLGSPLHDYRMLAWWAWQYGARGVGFWSYSDTGGSSAWVDIDGSRPDWAVVYESSDGIVSSRRWEAFREGLEDYILLSGVKESERQRIMPLGDQNFDQWDIATIERIRNELLDSL